MKVLSIQKVLSAQKSFSILKTFSLYRLLPLLFLGLLTFNTQADGLRFSETMSGYGTIDNLFRDIRVDLNITIDDIDAWKENPNHMASLQGQLVIDSTISHPVYGYLNILSPGNIGTCGQADDCYHLVYWMYIDDGKPDDSYFIGMKTVRNDSGFDVIDDMTTLVGCFTQTPDLPLSSAVSDICGSQLQFAWWDPANLYDFTTSFEVFDTPWWRYLLVPGKFLSIVFGNLAQVYFPWIWF
ncbi:hypothetical protein [Hahella sp. CCB-MM4]|uniref:hypothetical protein n=1 Tax=Hahella sp. (strain CCB-MM4) TaxID=1926491 RepID=UPI0011401C59|nr:hypothetical protein [Hahella sp. CCB-MM4]